MNAYDLIVVLLAALAAYRGYRVGLVGRLFGWLAAALGLLLAARYAGPVSDWLVRRYDMSSVPAHLLAYVGVTAVAAAALLLFARLLTRVIGRLPVAGGANHLGGALAGVFAALVCAALVTGVLVRVPLSHSSFARTVRHSQTAEIVRGLSSSWERRLKVYVSRSGGCVRPDPAWGASPAGTMHET